MLNEGEPPAGRLPTLRDVATRAGVSVGTASGVFNHKSWVSTEARAAVLTAAAAVGYQPRARAARASAVKAVGLIAPPMGGQHITTSPFYAYVVHGVERECQRQELSLMYAMTSTPNPSPADLPRMIQERQVQGLAVVSAFAPEFYGRLLGLGLPFVCVNQDPEVLTADVVISDDEQGGYLATTHLIAHGHCPPAILVGPLDHTSIQRRLDGYRRALAEHGLPFVPEYVRECDLSVDGGALAMLRLLEGRPAPTGVFCCNDMCAIGALRALSERGLSVPDDVSLVGYDDVEMARLVVPPLTTIAVDTELMGALGVRYLLWRIADPQGHRLSTRLEVRLVERRSVRALHRAGRD